MVAETGKEPKRALAIKRGCILIERHHQDHGHHQDQHCSSVITMTMTIITRNYAMSVCHHASIIVEPWSCIRQLVWGCGISTVQNIQPTAVIERTILWWPSERYTVMIVVLMVSWLLCCHSHGGDGNLINVSLKSCQPPSTRTRTFTVVVMLRYWVGIRRSLITWPWAWVSFAL